MLRVMQIPEQLVDCIIKTENERSLSMRIMQLTTLEDVSAFDHPHPQLHVRLRPRLFVDVRKACVDVDV